MSWLLKFKLPWNRAQFVLSSNNNKVIQLGTSLNASNLNFKAVSRKKNANVQRKFMKLLLIVPLRRLQNQTSSIIDSCENRPKFPKTKKPFCLVCIPPQTSCERIKPNKYDALSLAGPKSLQIWLCFTAADWIHVLPVLLPVAATFQCSILPLLGLTQPFLQADPTLWCVCVRVFLRLQKGQTHQRNASCSARFTGDSDSKKLPPGLVNLEIDEFMSPQRGGPLFCGQRTI